MPDTVLVVGGTGVFGGRLCAALSRDPDLAVVVAARNLENAQAQCALHGGQPLALDRDAADLAARVAAVRPFVVIDAAGPFQAYGDNPYRLARAAIAVRAHYLDLSDGAAFTAGIAALDGAARQAGTVAISGASSVPGLSSAAVVALVDGIVDVHLVESVILPGNRAPRGLSVVRAILAQAGQPMAVWRGEHWQDAAGWSSRKRYRLDLPDCAPVTRSANLIGAPDLALFPAWFRARSAMFRAGLELPVLHRGLAALAMLVRWRMIPDLARFARPLTRIADLLEPFGSDRGGMQVRVAGLTRDGQAETRTWTLLAEKGDGPQIPAIAARVLVAALRAGRLAPGARPCLGAFTLEDAERAMAGLAVKTGRQATRAPLVFRTVLGDGFGRLPAALRDLHTVIDARRFAGHAKAERGTSLLSRLIGAVLGLPAAAADVPVTVDMVYDNGVETWTRTFAGARFRSCLSAKNGILRERFGPLSFDLRLVPSDERLDWSVVGGRLLGLPLPRILLPHAQATERVDAQGRACFDVRIAAPLAGLIARYEGWVRSETGEWYSHLDLNQGPPDPQSGALTN